MKRPTANRIGGRAGSFGGLGLIAILVASTLPRSMLGGGIVTDGTDADLRAALSGGGDVVFAFSGTVTLTNTLTVSADARIMAGGYRVTIDGSNAVRLFLVETNVNFEIQGLTLANGLVVGPRGVDGCSPTPGGDGFGAGILNQGGTVTLVGCTLSNLVAVGGHAGDPHAPCGSAAGGNGFGGSLCNLGGSLDLTNCLLTANQAVGGAGSQFNFLGGNAAGNGGYGSGAAIYSDGGAINLEKVNFIGNLAKGGAWNCGRGGNGVGGGLFAGNSKIVVTQSLIISNAAVGGSYAPYVSSTTGYGSGNGLGGGIFLSADCTAILRLCSFGTNSAIGGVGDSFNFNAAGMGQGGAVYNSGYLDVWDSTFSSNASAGGYGSTQPQAVGQGGAIYSSGTLFVNGSTFVTNTAVGGDSGGFRFTSFPPTGDGGAIWSSGGFWATNSTFAANRAAGGQLGNVSGAGATGGGVRVAGGTAMLVNVTIAQNRADGWVRLPSSDPAYGGGLNSTGGTVTMRNSIVANSGYGGEVWGTLNDAGYNICSDATAHFSATGSLNSTDPLLGPLSDNGGPTATMVLLAGSPGRDAIASGYPSTDQRGVKRPQGPAGDIGALEDDQGAVVAPQLTFAISGKEIDISFTADAGRVYRLLASSNFTEWSPIATNSASSGGGLHFVQPITANPRVFFRIVSP